METLPQYLTRWKKPWSQLTMLLSSRVWALRFNRKMKNYKGDIVPVDSSSESSSSMSTDISRESSVESNSVANEELKECELKGNLEKSNGDDVDLMETAGKVRCHLTQDEYSDYLKEAYDETGRKNPNPKHLKKILVTMYDERRCEIKQINMEKCPMMSSILVDWPCLGFGEYVSYMCNV